MAGLVSQDGRKNAEVLAYEVIVEQDLSRGPTRINHLSY